MSNVYSPSPTTMQSAQRDEVESGNQPQADRRAGPPVDPDCAPAQARRPGNDYLLL
jgi:hypothetical protein